MSKPMHAPWTVYQSPGGEIEVNDAQGGTVAGEVSDLEAARIIAGCPAMLELLREARERMGARVCGKRLGGDPDDKRCPAEPALQRCWGCRLETALTRIEGTPT